LVDEPSEILLLMSEVLDKFNFSIIVKIFYALMFLLLPDIIRHDEVLLFVSDVDPYMKKIWYSYENILLKYDTRYMFGSRNT